MRKWGLWMLLMASISCRAKHKSAGSTEQPDKECCAIIAVDKSVLIKVKVHNVCSYCRRVALPNISDLKADFTKPHCGVYGNKETLQEAIELLEKAIQKRKTEEHSELKAEDKIIVFEIFSKSLRE